MTDLFAQATENSLLLAGRTIEWAAETAPILTKVATLDLARAALTASSGISLNKAPVVKVIADLTGGAGGETFDLAVFLYDDTAGMPSGSEWTLANGGVFAGITEETGFSEFLFPTKASRVALVAISSSAGDIYANIGRSILG